VLHNRHCKDKPEVPGRLLANDEQLLGTAQTITAGVAIRSGFGKDYGLLTSVDVLRTRQALFAAELLYLLANAAAKCSVALLFARLLSQKSHIKVCYGVAAICAAWGPRSRCRVLTGVTDILLRRPSQYSMLVLLFQVRSIQLTRLKITFWRTTTAFNIIIEMVLGSIPFWLVWGLQTSTYRKISIITVFSLRTPYVPFSKLESASPSPFRR
jgi:hypothetical protein